MKKVVFIYRKSSNDRFSIENVSNSIIDELKYDNIILNKFELSDRVHLFFDIFRLLLLKCDIYVITGDCNYISFFLSWKKPVVLIAHDIGHFVYTLGGIKKKIYGFFWWKLPLIVSRKVVCVSENTRQMITSTFTVDKNKLCTIHNSVNKRFFDIEAKSELNSIPVILQVGTANYKNILVVIKAIEGIKCKLVIVGSLTSEEIRLLNIKNISFKQYQSIEFNQLLELYSLCDIVTFVSIGEGFGLPIIEAQAASRPVIVSNLPPMSIIAGENACLVDPLSFVSVRQAINKVIVNNKYRKFLIKEGVVNAQKYHPKLKSKDYFDLLSSI